MYRTMKEQIKELIDSCPCPLSSMANMSSLIFNTLPDINWAGFYLASGQKLLLGPFQGKVACTQIPFGKGVCGTAAQTRLPQVVMDVEQFPGHIACDSASRSEIVIPLIRKGILYGVLDIDSPILNRFSESDLNGLAEMCEILMKEASWDQGLL